MPETFGVLPSTRLSGDIDLRLWTRICSDRFSVGSKATACPTSAHPRWMQPEPGLRLMQLDAVAHPSTSGISEYGIENGFARVAVSL